MSKRKKADHRWTDEQLRNLDTGIADEEIEIKRNAILKFLEHKERLNKATDYIDQLDRVLTEFREFIYHGQNDHICNISYRDVIKYNSFLKGESDRETYYTITDRNGEPKQIDISDTTRHGNLQFLADFYAWLNDDDIVSTNPALNALKKLPDNDFDLTPPDRPRIEMFEMKKFLQWLPNPLTRAYILLKLKTSGRLGQCVNIDLCDVHIDHPLYDHLREKYDIELTHEIRDKPDSLYFMPGFNAGTKVRGEIRQEGSKTQRDNGSIVPIDDELKTALIEYLLVRKPSYKHESRSTPLFVKLGDHGDSDRLTQDVVYGLLTVKNNTDGVLKEYGWYERGAPTEENVTDHYFRHYFTHNHKHNKGVYRGYMDQAVRRYIRGDVPKGNSAEESVYDHDDWNEWTEYIKKPYLKAVYTFDLYD